MLLSNISVSWQQSVYKLSRIFVAMCTVEAFVSDDFKIIVEKRLQDILLVPLIKTFGFCCQFLIRERAYLSIGIFFVDSGELAPDLELLVLDGHCCLTFHS